MRGHCGPPFNLQAALRSIFTVARSNHFDCPSPVHRRDFHNFFVTHLPSSSLAPDKNHANHHRFPRSESQPHSGDSTRSAAHLPQNRDTTIVRIPIRSAKHHFGAGVSRGSRPYNEDTNQAGTIDIPAFAKRQPTSRSYRRKADSDEARAANSESGDPQVFYFGVFDGHGGVECSEFLRDRLHGYVEEAALLFNMKSTLHANQTIPMREEVRQDHSANKQDVLGLQKSLVKKWGETVGGYFKRFRPEWFPALQGDTSDFTSNNSNNSIEPVLTYAFLKADLEFTSAQAAKHSSTTSAKQDTSLIDDPVLADRPLNDDDVLFHPDRPASQNLARNRQSRLSSSPDLKAPIGGSTRFKGGSTASIALISTPSPTPFWHPASSSTLVVAHVGDTRILLCRTADGRAVPLTTNHHPDAPVESTRLRKFAGAFVTDSFGEERIAGLANTRSFGDIASKRLGVSAEPQITRIEINPAEFSFFVLMSDGISGHLHDQEIVDLVKEAKTPAQGAEDLVNFAVEVSLEGDNATALVVRLGGWERRLEGGTGSLGTKEQRDFRRKDAMNPRSRRQ